MPKLLVLFHPDDITAAALAESAAEGARGVRFMEVDVRTFGAPADRVKPLESAAAASEYDGVVLAGRGLDAFISELAAATNTANTVFSAIGGEAASLVARCAEHGGVIVALSGDANDSAHAKAVGARAAKVVGWVRHALGHEAEHHHNHAHKH